MSIEPAPIVTDIGNGMVEIDGQVYAIYREIHACTMCAALEGVDCSEQWGVWASNGSTWTCESCGTQWLYDEVGP